MSALSQGAVAAARAAALAAAACVAIATELAPLSAIAWESAATTPDLLLCLLGAAALRRPAAAAPALVLALGLTRDLLAGGAVGAGALGLLLAAGVLRAAAEPLRRRSFLSRWGAFAGAAALGALTPWLLLTLTLAPAPTLAEIALRVAATALAFPLFALALRLGPRIGPAARLRDAEPIFARRRV